MQIYIFLTKIPKKRGKYIVYQVVTINNKMIRLYKVCYLLWCVCIIMDFLLFLRKIAKR